MARPLAVLTFLALSTLPSLALAGGTKTFEVLDYDDFDEGETEGAAIESTGKVTPGLVPQRADVAATTAFTCIGEAKTALVGTGDSAAILRVTPSTKKVSRKPTTPKAAKAKAETEDAKPGPPPFKVETLAELDGVVVSALTRLSNGDVIAATLPGGKLHRVSKGKVSPFAELKVEQIWALQVHEGRLLIATGPKGELWSTDLSGKDPKVVLDVDDKDLLSMAVVGKQVVVGASPSAKLYRVTDDLEGEVLHEFRGEEVRALAVTERGLVAAINDFSERKLSGLSALTKTLNRTSLVGQPPTGNKPESPSQLKSDAMLYHVDLGPKLDLDRATEAPWETWLERDKQYFTALLPTAEGVLVASSAGGKVYRVQGPRQASTVADLDEIQATGLCQVGKGGPVFATTAHGGAVYQLRAGPASLSLYRTEVFDGSQPSRFGALVVRGTGKLTVRARSGPTSEPSTRWGAWTSVPVKPGPGGLRGSLAKLAKRRHVQVEVALGSSDAELRAIELFYAPENLAPLLKEVDVRQPRFDADDDDEPDSDVTIKWDAEARDDDDLIYDVRIRPEGTDASQWVALNRDEPVTKSEFKLDLTTVPDGIYEVEVRASDEPSNGSADALTDELVSAPFVVDRQRPVVAGPKVTGDTVTAIVTDAGGYVHDVAYSIDGGPFRAASVSDGLLDGPRETVVVKLPPSLGPGKHRLVLRARDSSGNIGTMAMTVGK